MKLCWLDVRNVGAAREAIVEEALHQRIDGIVAADVDTLRGLPPTVTRVLFPRTAELPSDLDGADGAAAADCVDVVILDDAMPGDGLDPVDRPSGVQIGRYVDVVDALTLERACKAASTEQWTLLRFQDPTKIPLDIVIAAAAGAQGNIVTMAGDVEEAQVIFGVLEHGSDGVMLAPERVGQATELRAAAQHQSADLELTELEVTAVAHVGMGERACVDTCTYFGKDEGILVGSHSKGMILCVSETHPLPYMPTRPFRVNAGAIMSYTLSTDGRTSYLSELRAGSKVLAVDTQGHTRVVTVGRVKIESRPLLSVDAVAPDGTAVNLILQDDWHVRVLGPGAAVLNSTELRPGDKVLGHLPVEDRHVGYAITEFCREQ